MCSIDTPDIPDPVTYAPAPPEPEPAPVLKEPKGKDTTATNVRAKRRGTRALRTDLGIPDSGSGAGKGLNIPA